MDEDPEDSITLLCPPAMDEQAVVGANPNMAIDLHPVIASIKRKREEFERSKEELERSREELERSMRELDHSCERARELETAFKTNEAERQQILVEAAALGMDHISDSYTSTIKIMQLRDKVKEFEAEVANLKVALQTKEQELADRQTEQAAAQKAAASLKSALRAKEKELDERQKKHLAMQQTMANLEATLRNKERELADRKKEHLATQQALSFAVSKFAGVDSVSETENFLRMMAAADSEPPKELEVHDVYRLGYWTSISLWTPGVSKSKADNRQMSEHEMLLRIHTTLSKPSPSAKDLSTVLQHCLALISSLRCAKKHPITATFSAIWSLALDFLDRSKATGPIILFALHELEQMARARFGGLAGGPDLDTCAWLQLPAARAHPITTLARARFKPRRPLRTLEEKLSDLHGRRTRPVPGADFFSEPDYNRGWLANKTHELILHINFVNHKLLIIHKSFCSLHRSSEKPGQLDLQIRACGGAADMWVRSARPELCEWLKKWANVEMPPEDGPNGTRRKCILGMTPGQDDLL